MYLRPFVKITWGGSIGNNEIWACSLHIIFPEGSSAAEGFAENFPGALVAISNALRAQHSTINGSIPVVQYEWTKFATIGRDGKYIGEAVTLNAAPLPGGYTEVNVSAYNGAAISLLGSVPRDSAGRGRFYPPGNAVAAEDGYFIGEDVQTRLATSWQTTFQTIQGALNQTGTNAQLGIVSEKGSGAQQATVAVRIGSVLDVQRRRKNRIQESYVERVI